MGRKKLYYPGMKSSEYWHQRMGDRDKKSKLSEDKVISKLADAYHENYLEITKEINYFYNKYAIENNLTYAEATKLLTPIEIKEYNAKMQKLKTLYDQTRDKNVLRELQIINDRGAITRLQSLLDTIDAELIKNTNKVQVSIEDHLAGTYKRVYKDSLEALGISKDFMPDDAIKEVLSYPWSGRQFSDRIWSNKTATMNNIRDTITKGFIQGQSVQTMSKELQRLEGVSSFQAERLVRTETNFLMNKSSIDSYKETGYAEVEVLVHFDERTCEECKDKDATIVKISEVAYGSNVPPFHPFCRCTVLPVIDSLEKITDDLELPRYIDSELEKYIKDGVTNIIDIVNEAKNTCIPNIKMQMYLEYTEYKQNGDLLGAFAYRIKDDSIHYNKNDEFFYDYDINYVLLHELGHRIDYNEIESWKNSIFIDAVDKASSEVINNKHYYEELFQEEGKYYYDDAFSDILSALSHGNIDVPVGHSREYWIANNRNRCAEIFADLNVIDYLNYDSKSEKIVKDLLAAMKSII